MQQQSAGWGRIRALCAALAALGIFLAALLLAGAALAHNVTEGDAGYVQEVIGFRPIAFVYLGARHMVTGYDHLLFLAGVIFSLDRAKDIATYVSIFAIGHSVTMVAGVSWQVAINADIIDAIIAFSVIYKALDNLGAFRLWFGVQPNTKAATLIPTVMTQWRARSGAGNGRSPDRRRPSAI